MNLKTNKSLGKLLFITLLLFNLISSCSSADIEFKSVGVNLSKSYKYSYGLPKLLILEDNTLVFINRYEIFLDLIKFNALHSDGNLISFGLKCPHYSKCILEFWYPLRLNYMLIMYHNDESYYVMYGMIVRSDGIVVSEKIPINLDQKINFVKFKLLVNDHHMFLIGLGSLENNNAGFLYTYFYILNTEKGIDIRRKWDGTYSLLTVKRVVSIDFDIVFTPYNEY